MVNDNVGYLRLTKFSNNTSQDVTMPYQIFNDVERISRDIELSKSFDFDSFEYTAKYLLSRREYDLKDSDETINSNSFATSQVFSTLEDRSLKIGLLWSSFGEDSILPILDSYPILPSPESNISLSPWVGKDRGTNSRKIFLLKSWETSALNFSLSTNIYEKYNFENESMIFKKFYEKKPVFFSVNTKNKNFNIFAKGNYSYEKSDFMAQMIGMKYSDEKTLLSLQKNNIIPVSYTHLTLPTKRIV